MTRLLEVKTTTTTSPRSNSLKDASGLDNVACKIPRETREWGARLAAGFLSEE